MTVSNWHKMMDINVLALCLCTKLAVNSMRDRGVDDGQVIHISRYRIFYLKILVISSNRIISLCCR